MKKKCQNEDGQIDLYPRHLRFKMENTPVGVGFIVILCPPNPRLRLGAPARYICIILAVKLNQWSVFMRNQLLNHSSFFADQSL